MKKQGKVILVFIMSMGIESRSFVNQHKAKDTPWICLKCFIVKQGIDV